MSDNPIADFLDRRDELAVSYRQKIEEMLGSDDYRFAEDTLLGILDYIDAESSITDKQVQAVENIFNSIYGAKHEATF